MIVIAVPIILFCVVLMTMYCLYQQYQRHSRPYAPPPDVDTSLLMPEEPQSLRELYDWSQSGSGSGLFNSQALECWLQFLYPTPLPTPFLVGLGWMGMLLVSLVIISVYG